ncbi:hypothetical protein Goarm_000592, partial [Gossypium armourianum]|nr:hypothetical protein [Gossypium armourianum]
QSGDDIGTITAKVEAPPYFPPPSNEFKDIWDVDYFIKSLSSEVFPRFQKYEVVRFAKTDSRLGNNLAVE